MNILKSCTILALASVFLTYSSLSSAYVGPGLGVGTIASVLGIAAGLIMLAVGVVWYPVKKLIRKFKSRK